MSTISVKAHFAAGHRILDLEGRGSKCRNIHGHTFHATWTFQQDAGRMAIEFGEVKALLHGILITHFDHAFVVHRTDDFLHYLKINDMRFYATDAPPTTEVIAAELAKLTIDRLTKEHEMFFTKEIKPAPWPDAQLISVHIEEGPENAATWEAPTPSVKDVFEMAGVDYEEAMKGNWETTREPAAE